MKKIFLFLASSLLVSSVCFSAPATMYVTVEGAGGKTGVNWDDAFGFAEFETDFEANAEAGDVYYIKEGTYTLTNAVSTALDGTDELPISLIGVVTATTAMPPTLSDYAYGDNRPLFAVAANSFVTDDMWIWKNLRFTVTGLNSVRCDTRCIIENVKSEQTSTVASRDALYVASSGTKIIGGEFISRNGTGVSFATGTGNTVHGSYFHNSRVGLGFSTNSTLPIITDNIFSDMWVAAITTNTVNQGSHITGNTFYNTVIGVSEANTGPGTVIIGNIFNKYTTGISFGSAQGAALLDYNNYDTAGTDVTNATKGLNDIELDPKFTNVVNISGTVATTSGAVLTAGVEKDFSGVVANVDYVWIVSGTGVTANEMHLITAVDDGANTLTIDPAPGNSSTGDIVWNVTTGHNYSVGTNLKAKGFPSAFRGSNTTSYVDIGAVQRVEPSASGGGAHSYGFSN